MHHFSLIDKPRKPASPLTVTDKLNKISVSIIFHFTQKRTSVVSPFCSIMQYDRYAIASRRKRNFPRVPSFIVNERVQWWISRKRIASVVDKSGVTMSGDRDRNPSER